MGPNLLYIAPDNIPSATIYSRPYYYLAQQGRLNFTFEYEFSVRPSEVIEADVVVACRSARPKYSELYKFIQKQGIPLVYQLDDLLYDVPDETPAPGFEGRESHSQYVLSLVRSASRVQVYTDSILPLVAEHNPNVTKLLPFIDWAEIPEAPRRVSTNPFDIIYPTARVYSDRFYKLFEADLLKLLEMFPDRFRLNFWGYIPSGFRGMRGVKQHRFEPNYTKYIRKIAKSGFAIGLAPLPGHHAFYDCKTDTKFREYGAGRVVGIYSESPVYKSVVHEETGLVVENTPGAFLQAIVHLSSNPGLIEAIREKAYKHLVHKYAPESVIDLYWASLDQLLANSEKRYKVTLTTLEKWHFSRSRLFVRIRMLLHYLYSYLVPGSIKEIIFRFREARAHEKRKE